MKTYIFYLLILGFLLPITTIAQSTDQNYIHKKSYTQPSTTHTQPNYIESVTYFDGLGSPMQSIAKEAGGQGQDIITPVVYDEFGRQAREYLPYARTSSSLELDPDLLPVDGEIALVNTHYQNKFPEDLTGVVNPYSKKVLEASPLNRVLEQAAPGSDWAEGNGHTIKFEYQANSASDKVRRFEVVFPSGNTEEPQLTSPGNGLYDANQLYKTVTKDENWQPNQRYPNDYTTEEYKNKQGQVVLKRTFNLGKWHDTYYVYDDYGNLTYVLPPKMATYADFWQTEASSQQHNFSLYDFYLPGYGTSQINYGSFYFDTNNRVLRGYASAWGFSGSSLNVTFKTGESLMNLPFGVDLSGLILEGTISYRDNQGNYKLGFVNATIIENNEIVLNEGFPFVEGTNFSINFSASLDDINLVLPELISSDINALAYQYKYDSRNRLIEKKIPGKNWEYIIYDKLDRPVLTQDVNLRTNNQWLFTKYDAFDRVVYTGIYTIPGKMYLSKESLQKTINSQKTLNEEKNQIFFTSGGAQINYTNSAFPTQDIEVLTVNYYDDYDFNMLGLSPEPFPVYDTEAFTTDTKTLATGSLVKVLDTNDWIVSLTKYDKKARPIYMHSKNNYLESEDITHVELDFSGLTLKTQSTHKKLGKDDIVTEDTFIYDHAQRLLKHTQNINGQGEELIVFNHYDELGQLVEKKVGGSDTVNTDYTSINALQTVNYTYNIRGWLKSINDPYTMLEGEDNDLFSFGLNYNTPEFPSTSATYNKPLYNGNISHTYWRTQNEDAGIKHYSYRYDALNRFTRAFFAEGNTYNLKFNEYIYNYDRNGNIGRLFRYGQNPSNNERSYPMDNLTYTYDEGNKLIDVKDSYRTSEISNSMGGFKDGNTTGDDYAYDENGNMISDANKGISKIEYNHLNLPTLIYFSGGKLIRYVYDATGAKLQKKVTNYANVKFTNYAGNYIYEDTGAGEVLKFFSHPEGYIEPNVTSIGVEMDYVYQYKDHLGNIRLSYKDKNKNGTIETGVKTLWQDDFETASGWDGSGHSWGWPLTEFDTQKKHKGNYSARVEAPQGHSRVTHSNEWVQIQNSEPTDYIYSCWAYSESPVIRLGLAMKEDSETENLTLFDDIRDYNTKHKWVYIEKRVTVPAHITSINLRLESGAWGNRVGSVWFDDVKIVELSKDDTEIVEENNYYPFGLKHKGYNNVVNGSAYPYGYNGKKENDELGLEWLDFGARNYDASLGRWMNLDPLAELMRRHSPYNYAFDNPVFFIDPDGRAPQASQTAGVYYDWDEGGYRTQGGDTATQGEALAQIDGNNSGECCNGQIGGGLKINFGDGKKNNVNLFSFLKVEKSYEDNDSEFSGTGEVKVNYVANFGKKNEVIVEASAGGEGKQKFSNNYSGTAKVESSASYDFSKNKLTFGLTAQSYLGNKLTDPNHYSATNQAGMKYDIKKGFSAYAQSKISTVPGSLNPSLGQNITLGGSYNFNSFSFTAKEDISAGYKSEQFKL